MVQFRLFGIPVTVQPWHWLLLSILGFLSTKTVFEAGLFVLAGFLSILVHELGHALTGKVYQAHPQIILHGMGGVAIFPNARFSRPQYFLLTAAGPGIQFLLGLVALTVCLSNALPDTPIRSFFWFLAIISVFWSLLNLIPVCPLDGGQMLHSVMGPSRRKQTLIISISSAVLAALVLGFAFKSILFPLLILHAATQNFQELKALKEKDPKP